MIAAATGRAENLKLLLTDEELRVEMLTKKNKEGKMAIHIATENNHLDVVETLLELGCDIHSLNTTKQTPLHLAAMLGHFELVKFLHEKGAAISKRDKLKRTPLILVCFKNACFPFYSHNSFKACKNGHLKIASYLLRYGADPDEADSSENSCIQYASAFGWKKIIPLLIEAGGDANKANAWKSTAYFPCFFFNQFSTH